VFSGNSFLEERTVLVFSGEKLIDIVPYSEAGEGLEHFNGILLPGMINTHCHLELAHMQDKIPKRSGLVNFVGHVVSNRKENDEIILDAIKEADRMMWQKGIQAVGDICNTPATIKVKKSSPLSYHNFIEVAGFPPAAAVPRFEAAKNIQREFTAHGLQATLTPHAPYSVSPELFEKIDKDVDGALLSVHNQEIEDENRLFLERTGDFLRMYQLMGINIDFFSETKKTSLQSWLPFISTKKSLLLVHNVAIDEYDLEFVKAWAYQTHSEVFFAVCAQANTYISDLLPPIRMLLEKNVQLCLGTDSLASNDKLDLGYEINLLEKHFPEVNIGTWLTAACVHGARALLISEQFGMLEIGKKPGLVLMKGEKAGRSFERII
jgi:cytosine/adenosine deaminase-related metal-dependent hydrolase